MGGRDDYGNSFCLSVCGDLMLILIDLRRQDRVSLRLLSVR